MHEENQCRETNAYRQTVLYIRADRQTYIYKDIQIYRHRDNQSCKHTCRQQTYRNIMAHTLQTQTDEHKYI